MSDIGPTIAVRSARLGRGATVSGTLLLVLVAGFGAVVKLNGGAPFPVDAWWHGISGVEPGTIAYAVAVALHGIGSAVGVAVCLLIVAAALLARHRWRDAAVIATTGLFGVVCSEGLKALVARPRPAGGLVQELSFSYPSGHSMGAAALATALMLLVLRSDGASRRATRWAVVGATAWTVLMMWSRTALGVHWLTDVIAGALLGVSVAILARAVWQGRSAAAPLQESTR
ncbi:MAG: phosphatase PAP2 family protein [Actinobacteria bacterium]|nr:phosphatase PAP2 family protein [Actinomycetota bacterium]